jgi:peptidoglycan/LPS O-acetylase OafA/YrhL
MIFIGIISYSLYLYQQFFTQQESYLTGGLPLSLVFLLIAAWLSYSCVEKPIQKLLKGWKNQI